MNKKVKRYFKLAVTILIVAMFVWFLIIYPFVSFKGYEKKMKEAAERYFVIKPGELPTGERIKTISLQDLFFGSYIKEDLYIPYTKEPCSLKDSWVKVRKENGEYKYYTYLKCGVLSSNVDHKGPTITLNGDEKITLTRGEEFKDPGIKKVVDNKDGKIDTKKVNVESDVDSSKTGVYSIKYSALDSLGNKTVVEREVEVVERLKSTTKTLLDGKDNFVGNPNNNYVYFSNMLFRIVDMDDDNVRIVSNYDIANVNYAGIDDWLDDVFYKHLNNRAKKLIVENEYCNMGATEETLTATECSSYTKKRKVYIPSIVDVNRAVSENSNFMKPGTMSWVSSEKDNKDAYLTRDFFFGYRDTDYMSFPKKYNFGVRPILTINGDTLIKGGDGTEDNPYILEDHQKGKANTLVSERETGEYISLKNEIFRILETESDGTTKIISQYSLGTNGEVYEFNYEKGNGIYNPNQKGNVGYIINNKASEYVDSSYFVNKKVVVPIYKEDSNYGKEVDIKNYKVKFSAPNMYDMFTTTGSTWFVNSSKDSSIRNVLSSLDVVMYGPMSNNEKFGVRVVGYLDKDASIISGDGTLSKPYKVSK